MDNIRSTFTDLSWMDESEGSSSIKADIPKADQLFGHVILSITIQNKGEFLKWKKYCEPNRKWDFNIPFPAPLQATYEFHTVQDVHMIAQKIVQLLQLGFNVYSARWQLKQYKSQLDQSL